MRKFIDLYHSNFTLNDAYKLYQRGYYLEVINQRDKIKVRIHRGK